MEGNAHELFYLAGEQLTSVVDLLVKHLKFDFAQAKAVHYPRLYDINYRVNKGLGHANRDRSKSSHRSDGSNHPPSISGNATQLTKEGQSFSSTRPREAGSGARSRETDNIQFAASNSRYWE